MLCEAPRWRGALPGASSVSAFRVDCVCRSHQRERSHFPRSPAAGTGEGPRGRTLTSWRTPWTTTRGRGRRCTILAAGLRGDSLRAGFAHLRCGERGGRAERRDTPPRLFPLTGRWQAAARPRHCYAAPRGTDQLRGRP